MSTNDVAKTLDIKTNWGPIMDREYSAGADDIEVMAALAMSRKQFDLAYNTNSTFKELVDIGRLRSAAWWRTVARTNLLNRNLNTTAWSFVMKNRFGWTEKSEAVNIEAPSKQYTDDEIRQQIAARLPGVAKSLGAIKKDADIIVLPDDNEDD